MQCVFIYGPVASGKLTVATTLGTLSDLPIFHNHLAVDAALSLFEFGSPSFVRLRELIWLSAFQEAAATNRSFIFTFNPEASVPAGFVDKAVNIIVSAGGTIHFIELTCSDAVIEARITNSSRTAFRKLTSLAQYRALRDRGAFAFSSPLKPHLVIPTDTTSPGEAARRIFTLVGSHTA
jgi:hypothetical protein